MALIVDQKRIYNALPLSCLEIEKNSNPDPGAPIALILIADIDHNEALTSAASRFFFSTFSKTHGIVFQIIKNQSDIHTAIDLTLKDRVKILIVAAHGDSKSMRLGKCVVYKIEDVKPQDYEGLPGDAQIFLWSCQTGNGLAQKIAAVTDRIVFAPMQDLVAVDSCMAFCPKHQLMEMRSRTNQGSGQHVGRFQKNLNPIFCQFKIDSEVLYFAEQRVFLGDLAISGDPTAQTSLGSLYQRESNREEAIHWYLKASQQGDSHAQFRLGCLFDAEGDFETAKTWYNKAAEKGHAQAQVNLGCIYMKLMFCIVVNKVATTLV